MRPARNEKSSLSPSVPCLWKVLILLRGIALWSLPSAAVSGSSEDARDVLKRGTMRVDMANGFWQATTVVGPSPSANQLFSGALFRFYGSIVTQC